MKAFVLFIAAVFISVMCSAQGETTAGSTDLLAGNLKFYVVASVLGLILLWIFVFLFSMEKQIKQLEDRSKN